MTDTATVDLTPSEILTRAADLIRDTAGRATPGPWRHHDCHLLHGGHTASVLSGEGNDTELRAWLPTFESHPWGEKRNVWNDARWVALLNPAVAPAIEAWLRAAAKAAEDYGFWIVVPDWCRAAGDFAAVVLGLENTPEETK